MAAAPDGASQRLRDIEAAAEQLHQALAAKRWERAGETWHDLHEQLRALLHHHPVDTLAPAAVRALRRLEQDIRNAGIELAQAHDELREQVRRFRGRRGAAAAYRAHG